MKKQKAPKWDRKLSEKIKRDYAPFPLNLNQLADLIQSADTTFVDVLTKIRWGPPKDDYGISNGEPLGAIFAIGVMNNDWDMQQSESTHKKVLKALYSTIYLKDKIEKMSSPEEAEQFYESLKKALRFFRPGTPTSSSSGVSIISGKRAVEELYNGDIPEWDYMGRRRINDSQEFYGRTKQLIERLREWHRRSITIKRTSISKSQSRKLLEDLERFPAGVPYSKKEYGQNQPDGIKELLERIGLEDYKKNVKLREDRIYLADGFRFILED